MVRPFFKANEDSSDSDDISSMQCEGIDVDEKSKRVNGNGVCSSKIPVKLPRRKRKAVQQVDLKTGSTE